MDARLTVLLALQAIDDEMDRLREARRLLPLASRAAESELARATEGLETLHRDLIELRKEADRRELDLRSREATIQRLEAQRIAVKTNREYAALTSEIGGAQADNARLEDQILTLYTKAEQAQKAHQEQAAEVQRLKERRDAALARHAEEAKRLDARERDLRQGHETARQQVPAEALQLYLKLRRRFSGPPLAAVRDEVCTGCHMSVAPQIISLLHLGRDLIQCTSCARILYLGGEEP